MNRASSAECGRARISMSLVPSATRANFAYAYASSRVSLPPVRTPVRPLAVDKGPASLVAVPLLIDLGIIASPSPGHGAAPMVGAQPATGRAMFAGARRGNEVKRARAEPVRGACQRPNRADLHGVA